MVEGLLNDEVRRTAVEAATKAGALLMEGLGRSHHVEYKGEVDLVTEMDRAAEDLIVEMLRSRFPDHGILTEERAEMPSQSGERWIVDPLDGTTNYAHGFPVFCVSIAFERNGDVCLGAVYCPTLDELFTAEKGRGALLNGSPIAVSTVDSLERALLATGFPYDLRTSRENNIDHFKHFAMRSQAIRRAGSAALDLCYTACGRFDGFWEFKLHPWDTAAGVLVVREAGGTVTALDGSPFVMENGEVVASNRRIHNEMLRVLALPS
ncbi:MAG TPA: inositol monophosphatase [Deltaproteobacteria bacterium]|nr:inositol monophosphatase [Deltaproteobacteria bacterium]